MDFKIQRNDITTMAVDAIVLPANKRLKEGKGVSAVIFGKAGRKQLKKELSHLGKVKVGNAVITYAYHLPSKYIIHAVVPKWRGGKHHEYEKLSKAYFSALCLADQQKCTSIAIPLLSAGNNGFDLDTAIDVAAGSIGAYRPTHDLQDVYLLVFDGQATLRMIQRNFEVEEVIDQHYASNQDDSYQPDIVKKAASGIQAAGDGLQTAGRIAGDSAMATGNALRIAGDLVNNDPALQQAIAVAAVQVASSAISGGTSNMIVDLIQGAAGKLLKK